MKSMTKLVLATLAAGFVSLGIPKLYAAPTDTIAVTVTLAQNISVAIDVSAWNLANIDLSSASTSVLCTASNDGNVHENFAIKGANGAGAWAIAGSPGSDTFKIAAATNATYDTWDIVLDAIGVPLAANVPKHGGTLQFKLQYSAPTADTKGIEVDQGFNVTVTASKYATP